MEGTRTCFEPLDTVIKGTPSAVSLLSCISNHRVYGNSKGGAFLIKKLKFLIQQNEKGDSKQAKSKVSLGVDIQESKKSFLRMVCTSPVQCIRVVIMDILDR